MIPRPFRPGDRVAVHYGGTRYGGERGTVATVSPISGTVIVKLDKSGAALAFGSGELCHHTYAPERKYRL